jgi:HAD-superfamily hydrolase, subfamily IIB
MIMQTHNIQAIFFDIDGTLVSFKTHTLSPTTKAAIRQLRDNGIKVIISTGRSMGDIINLEDLIFDGYITANGAYCVNTKHEVIAQQPISKDNLERLAHNMEEKPFSCLFVTDKGNFINYIDDSMIFLNKLIKIPLPEKKPISEIFTHTIYQLDAFIDTKHEAELFAHVLTDCVGRRWHPIFIDINAKECSKATGIDQFLSYYGLSNEHTMAFGDGDNDIAMLKHVAIGVAMGNAKDHVKTAADYVTTSVDDNGIVNALKHFKLIAE